MPEAYARAHDAKEPLSSKVEMMKFFGRVAGMGVSAIDGANSAGEKFTVTINMGADRQLTIEKQLPAQVIEAEPIDNREEITRSGN